MHEILCQAKPGDVIAFSGNGLDAKIIQWFTLSPYSHVGIVLDTKYANPNQDILIAESTTYTSVPNFNQQTCIKGVQVHWLIPWLQAYQTCGQAWLFPLQEKPSQDKTAQMQAWLWQLYRNRVPFSCPKSVAAWFSRNQYLDTNKKSNRSQESEGLFCSELVTEALQIAGTIDPELNPATQTPKNVIEKGCFQSPKLLLSS